MKNLIDSMRELSWMEIAIGAIIVLLLSAMLYAGIQESRQWEAFKVGHDCKVVGQKKGTTSTGIAPIMGGNGGIGVLIVNNPSEIGWLCDDGVTYWR